MRRAFTKTSCVIFLLLTVLAGCNSSPEAKRDRFVSKGKAFLQKQDYSRAILEFRNAARAVPADADVYYQLGLAYRGAQDYPSTKAAFEKALEVNPRHVRAQLGMVQLLSLTSDKDALKEALERLKVLIDGSREDTETLNTLAFTELKLGNPETAMQILADALAESPGELSSAVLLAETKLFQKDAKGAEAVLVKACHDSPKSTEARRYLAEFYINQHEMQEAETQLRLALQLDPRNGPALMDIGRLLLTFGRKTEAEASFKQLAGYSGYDFIYGIFLFQEDRYDEAVREFERLAKEGPDDRAARTRLVIAYRANNRPADADRILQQALRKNPKDIDALVQRAEVFLSEGRYLESELDLNKVLELMPNAAEVHYLIAKLNQARGMTHLYRDELSKALQLQPSLLPVRLELAQALLEAKEGRSALDLMNEAPEVQKSSALWLAQRNWALWAVGELKEMRAGIDLGLSRERSPELLIQDGLWKLRANSPARARESLEEALKVNPADLRALEGLRQSYLAEKNSPLALQKVKEYSTQQPKSASVQEFLGLLLLASGNRTEARAAFTKAKEIDPRLISADLSLVQIDVAESRLEDAESRLENILKSNSTNITARRWLGNINLLRGDHGAAIEQFRQVVAADPNDAQASNNLAYLLVQYRDDHDTALAFAQKAVELAPTTPEYCDTLGWVLYRKGVYDSAIKYLERASSNPQNVIWKYHLAMAYAKAGDIQRARTTLNAALKVNAKVPEAKDARELLEQTR